MEKTLLEELTSTSEGMGAYQQERLIVAVTELLCKALKEKSLKRSDLAELLGKSKGRVSQYLDGTKNMTLRTVADLFTALELRLRVHAEPLSIHESDVELYDAPLPVHPLPENWGKSNPWHIPALEANAESLGLAG